MTHYEVLGLLPNASVHEIRSAYRRLSQKHHPDKGGDTERFMRLQTANQVLSDVKLRKDYDSQLKLESTMTIFETSADIWRELLTSIKTEKEKLK